MNRRMPPNRRMPAHDRIAIVVHRMLITTGSFKTTPNLTRPNLTTPR
jgi:hypothetical protein